MEKGRIYLRLDRVIWKLACMCLQPERRSARMSVSRNLQDVEEWRELPCENEKIFGESTISST